MRGRANPPETIGGRRGTGDAPVLRMRAPSLALLVLVLPLASCAVGVTSPSQEGSRAQDFVGPSGGTVDSLDFAVVGDTRPALPDGISGYPVGVITRIWQDVENEMPRPSFAVTTGDYLLADPWSDEGGEQLDAYLTARANFENTVFYALGNHECATTTTSNCGPGTFWGETHPYRDFKAKMLSVIGRTDPYYSFRVDANDGSWTAKFVVIAGNYWNADQAAWLDQAMADPTTYTFVVRHEGYAANTAPGVTPSEAILAQYPYTLMLAGHVHTFTYDLGHKEVLTGNGGAPLESSVNYGYTVVQRDDDGTIRVTNYDYQSHDVIGTLAVDADGNAVP